MEVPTKYLKPWSGWTDLDFALAHKVLEDPVYGNHFANRPADRELILDNSMHELGHPLTAAELATAGHRCRADYIIAPDLLGEPEQNVKWFRHTRQLLGRDFRIGAVLCGRTRAERKAFLWDVMDAHMLLLPFREPRLRWYLEHQTAISVFQRIHLLGVNTLDELSCFAAATGHSRSAWSVDTAKALKLAVAGRRVDDGQPLRGSPLGSKELLDLDRLSPSEIELTKSNVDVLRRICEGEAE